MILLPQSAIDVSEVFDNSYLTFFNSSAILISISCTLISQRKT